MSSKKKKKLRVYNKKIVKPIDKSSSPSSIPGSIEILLPESKIDINNIKYLSKEDKVSLSTNKLLNLLTNRFLIISSLLLILIGIAFVFSKEYFFRVETNAKPQELSEIEDKDKSPEEVLSKLKSLISVDNDIPTIARIKDIELLKKSNPSFYTKAMDGDYLIVFTKQAIILREQASQIINIAPISQNPKPSELNIGIITTNKTPDNSLNMTLTKVSALGPEYIVLNKEKVNSTIVKENIIIDLTGSKDSRVALISKSLGLSVTDKIPSGITAPAGISILIIIIS